MKTFLKSGSVVLIWLYASGVVLWFVLHSWLGDTLWWLALLNAFAPYLFLPLAFVSPLGLVYRERSIWIAVGLPVIIFLWLYGHLFLPAWPLAPVNARTTLTVMTFNIWGGSRTQETAQVILADGSPDIVAIQELDPQMTEILLDEVGAEYPYRVFQTNLQSDGMGVLSRYPLTELDTSRLAAPGWEIQVVQVHVDSQAFILYNCRLHGSNILVYLEAGVALADEVRASFEMRQSLMHRLEADIASRPGPVMVVGDFNSTDQSDVYAILTSHLTDAHRAAGWGLGHTFPAYRGSFRGIPILPLQMRLDMILYSEELTAASSRVGSSPGESDHLPVLAQLVWPR